MRISTEKHPDLTHNLTQDDSFVSKKALSSDLELQNAMFKLRLDTKKPFVSMKISIVKRNYINKEGKSPLYLFVSKSGKRTRTFLDIYVPSNKWNAKTEMVTGKSKEIDDLNLIISNIKSKITSIKTFYRLSEKYLTIEKFMEEFQNENTRADFIGFFKYQLDAQKGVLEFNTHRKQLSILRKLKNFRSTIYFSDIDMKFINDYKSYLRIELKNSQTTINSNIIILKKFLRLAINTGIKMPLNLSEVKGGNTNGSRTNLNPEEVKKLLSLDVFLE